MGDEAARLREDARKYRLKAPVVNPKVIGNLAVVATFAIRRTCAAESLDFQHKIAVIAKGGLPGGQNLQETGEGILFC